MISSLALFCSYSCSYHSVSNAEKKTEKYRKKHQRKYSNDIFISHIFFLFLFISFVVEVKIEVILLDWIFKEVHPFLSGIFVFFEMGRTMPQWVWQIFLISCLFDVPLVECRRNTSCFSSGLSQMSIANCLIDCRSF